MRRVGVFARALFAAWTVLGFLATPARASGAEMAAVIIELRVTGGEVRVRRSAENLWRTAQPLQSLETGDQVTATGEGRAVLVLTQGRGTRTVTAANSPYTANAAVRAGGGDRAWETLARVVDFFLGYRKDPATVPVAVRAPLSARVAILSPRNTLMLPGSVQFEWTGWQSLRYRVRVIGPAGILWEAADLRRGPIAYPATAPALTPGTPYVWQLEAPNLPIQEARFTVLTPAEAERVKTALSLLAEDPSGSGSLSSVAVLRAGFLLRERLLADARWELVVAVSADPDEPTLHLLLGQVYDTIGLRELGALELLTACELSKGRPWSATP